MRHFVIAIVMLMATAAVGQVQHVPDAFQCIADQRVWMSRLQDNNDRLQDVSYNDLAFWARVMMQCVKVDPASRPLYINTYGEANAERILRFHHYLQRNNLWDQFLGEDVAGER